MTKTIRPGFFQPHLLTLAVTAVTLGISTQAHAVSFNIGEIEGQFDSTLSLGASWSTADADKDFIGYNNGGRTATHTTDDGRLNFKKGETFSKIFKGLHDLELKYGDTGVFMRGKYWYDFELKDEHRLFKEISDDNRKEAAQSSGAQLLDAFVYHNYDIAEMPGSVRLGKQVVSWGESTFIPNSINSINPVDVSAFRRPGAEVKEALVPVNMFYLSQSLTDSLSAEAFYQLEWDQTVLDNCGTFFGGDVVPDGCDQNNANNAAPGFGALMQRFEPIAAANGQGFLATDEGVILPRGGDRDARDNGQWGLAMRWMTDSVEYGAYAMNYHSRNPYYSSQTAGADTLASLSAILPAVGQACAGVPGCSSVVQGMALSTVLGNSNYFIEYPEDIRLYGLSFATTLPSGTAWSGELSYRPNMPLQISTPDVSFAVLNPIAPTSSPIPTQPGQDNHGYQRKEMTQLQTTFVHFFERALGTDRITMVGELGVTHLGGLDHTSEMRFGRSPEFGQWSPSNNHGFYTANSWGYRVRSVFEYSDVFAGVNLKPNLAWAHDVEGYGPTFNEGSKAVSVGLDADYRNTYTASLSYTDFFGGDFNTQIDRDFLALSVGVNF